VNEVFRIKLIRRFVGLADNARPGQGRNRVKDNCLSSKVFVANHRKLFDQCKMINENDITALTDAIEGEESSELLIEFCNPIG
jgi:hypothetical protein